MSDAIRLLVVVLLIALGWFTRGWYEGDQEAKRLAANQRATESVADAVSKMQIKNTTIYQKVVERTFHEPVYQDCKHTPEEYEHIKELFK